MALDSDARNNGGVLGVSHDGSFHTRGSDLAAGDLVLMFTDGLFEINGADGEILGAEGSTDLAASLINWSGEELLAALVEAARAFSPKGRFEDDVCLLGLEILETTSQ